MRMALVSVLMMSAPLSFAGNLFINGEKSDAAPRPKNALVRKGSTSMLPLAQADGRESRTWEIRSEDLNLANVKLMLELLVQAGSAPEG